MWNLLHAWREWLSGHDTAGIRVFGIEVLWWGRIGKLFEFLGGLTVVIDLLGRERMQAFHATLQRRRIRLFARLRGLEAPRVQSSARTENSNAGDPPGFRVFYVVGTLAMGLFLFVGLHYMYAGGDSMPIPVQLIFIAVVAPTIGGVGFGGGGYLVGLILLEAFVVTTLGQLQNREGLESRLKWIGLVIFAVGFSMDLLSS